MFDWDVCHDCNDLQDALDRNKEVFAPTWNESMLFAKAARLVADPNIEAAAWIVMRETKAHSGPSPCVICRQVAQKVVAAALTGDTE